MSGDQMALLDEPSDAEQAVAPEQGRTRRGGPVTSKRAAAAVNLKVGALKHRILLHLRDAGAHGANDFELWRACDPHGRTHSAATRRLSLDEAGLVRSTAFTRPTDSREGFVHVITERGLAVLAELEAKAAA